MKVAFVHDWLLGIGGGEKVLEALCELYDGPIYTLLAEEHLPSPFSQHEIQTSFLQKIPRAKQNYQSLLPLFPKAIESFDLSSFDLILSSSHSVAKSIPTHRNQMHICYCHTPMRYIWDLYPFYLKQLNPLKRLIARPILHGIKKWDQKTHDRVHHYIANSKHVANRIQNHYGRESTVIYPPVETHLFDILEKREDYYVTCSRLVPYKRVDILIEAFAKLPNKTLKIIGDGPELKKLKAKAPKNVEFLGRIPHPLLREVLAKARAFIFAAWEDFGISLVEAQAAGIPVIAYGMGGALETVLPAQTGIFFKEQSPKSLIEAVVRFEKMEKDFEPEKIRKHALRFSKERFQREMTDFIQKALTR